MASTIFQRVRASLPAIERRSRLHVGALAAGYRPLAAQHSSSGAFALDHPQFASVRLVILLLAGISSALPLVSITLRNATTTSKSTTGLGNY